VRKNFEIPSTNEVMELLAKGLSEVPLNNEELEIVGQYIIWKRHRKYIGIDLRSLEK